MLRCFHFNHPTFFPAICFMHKFLYCNACVCCTNVYECMHVCVLYVCVWVRVLYECVCVSVFCTYVSWSLSWIYFCWIHASLPLRDVDVRLERVLARKEKPKRSSSLSLSHPLSFFFSTFLHLSIYLSRYLSIFPSIFLAFLHQYKITLTALIQLNPA